MMAILGSFYNDDDNENEFNLILKSKLSVKNLKTLSMTMI